MKLQVTKRKWLSTLVRFVYLLLILAPLFSTATYTWFSLTRAPKVNDMALYINVPQGLEISFDPTNEEAWGQNLNYSEIHGKNTVLKPVTWSDEKQCFFTTYFGNDGRISSIGNVLSDEYNTNRDDAYGYYLKFTFYARTGENVTVSLKEGEESAGTYLIGTPVWDSENILHHNGGIGAESAVRVGFRITRFDPFGNPLEEEPAFIIYEPNADLHTNYEHGYRPTESIDGTENLVPEDRLITQSHTVWFEADPVQRNVVVYRHGEFLTDPHLFDLDENCTAKIDVYVWLEGQDEDCTNEIGKDAKLFSNVQFHAVSRPQSGMEDIEPTNEEK